MTFPTTTIPTTNLDNGSDDPSQARGDLLTAVQTLNTIITDKNSPNGVVVLQSDGTIIASQIPTTITTPSGQLTLNPNNNIVKIQNFLRLQTIPKTTLVQIIGNAGDMAMCSNADGGNPALAISDGTNWYYLPKASLTLIS
jgi:hypothetical protein